MRPLNIFTREFFIGLVLATGFWLGVASTIDVPQYTLVQRTVCT
jgi:hypothetical protein